MGISPHCHRMTSTPDIVPMATPKSFVYPQETECDHCGASAVTEFETYSFCDNCDVHLRETLAESSSDEEDYGVCDDCQEAQAECVFLHLDGRRFHLCNACWQWADHEDDYLMFCECEVPDCIVGGIHCRLCQFKIRSWYDGIEVSSPSEDDDYEEEDLSDEELDDLIDQAIELYNPVACLL